MAKSKTPAKRARNSEAKRIDNKAVKTQMKNIQVKYEASLKENDLAVAQENLTQLISIIDKSVSKGILHKKNAARKKSNFTKQLQTFGQ
ncbi:MAG TPA: 30S ribosomal protein S20 [Syntrophomonadaceae bacterium]|nr:30S ribosomal protein S20 [Syntrophomonadaceae bacterium]